MGSAVVRTLHVGLTSQHIISLSPLGFWPSSAGRPGLQILFIPLGQGPAPFFSHPHSPGRASAAPRILLCFLSTFIASQRRLDLGSKQVLLGPAVDHLERWQRLPVGPPGGRGLEEVTSGVPGASWCSVGEPGCIVLGVGGRASPPGLPLGHPLVHPVTGDSQGAEGTFLPKMSFPFTTLKEERALIWPAGWPPSVAAGTRGEGEGGTSRRAPLPSTAAGDPSSQAGLLQPEIHTRTCASHQPLPLHPTVDIPLCAWHWEEVGRYRQITQLGLSRIQKNLFCLLEWKDLRFRTDFGDSDKSPGLRGRRPGF